MPDNCTIYCKAPDNAQVMRIIHTYFKTATEDTEGSTILHGNTGSMRITCKIFQELGDSFCYLIRSTWVHAERLLPHSKRNSDNPLIKSILNARLAVGIVVEPNYDADERYGDLVFEIAKNLDGVIFNGIDFLDHECESLTAKYW